MQAIDLGDEIIIELSDQDSFTCTDLALPLDHRNLVIKARDLFRKKTHNITPVKIHLAKKVPAQAGLGGGSGNAATTLWALNHLLNTKISDADLAAWSSEIGSDIPFFFSSGTAYCTGRGEIVEDLPRYSAKMWIVKPSVGLSTPDVFRHYKPHFAEQNELGPIYTNDLCVPAEEVAPILKEFKNTLLKQGFDVVQMTGSGSAYYCMGNRKPLVDAACYQVRTINRAPGSWYSMTLNKSFD